MTDNLGTTHAPHECRKIGMKVGMKMGMAIMQYAAVSELAAAWGCTVNEIIELRDYKLCKATGGSNLERRECCHWLMWTKDLKGVKVLVEMGRLYHGAPSWYPARMYFWSNTSIVGWKENRSSKGFQLAWDPSKISPHSLKHWGENTRAAVGIAQYF